MNNNKSYKVVSSFGSILGKAFATVATGVGKTAAMASKGIDAVKTEVPTQWDTVKNAAKNAYVENTTVLGMAVRNYLTVMFNTKASALDVDGLYTALQDARKENNLLSIDQLNKILLDGQVAGRGGEAMITQLMIDTISAAIVKMTSEWDEATHKKASREFFKLKEEVYETVLTAAVGDVLLK